jgi:hypothetical protein
MEGPADPQVGGAEQADREGTAEQITIVSGGQKSDAAEAGQDDSRPGKEDTEGSRVGLGGASSSGAHEGRPLPLRGGAPDGDEMEDEGEDLPGGNGALLGSLAQQYATDSEDGEGDNDEDEDEDDGADYGGEEEEEGEGAAAGDPGLNTFELAILAPEDRRYLSPLEQAKVDNLLACLDSTVLIELAKGVMLQLNITQTALAHMAQVSQSILSYWLAGRLRPSQENINVKMRAFLRSYCVATEVAPTDGDEDEAGTYSVAGSLPFYDVEGFYAHPGYALEEAEPGGMAGGYGANGGAGSRAEEASSEGSELLHHLAARTAATTGRALHPAPAAAGPWPGGEAGGAESKEDEDRRQRGLAEQASTSTAAGWEESDRGGGEQLGTGPAAGRGGGARKASRSQRKRGGATGAGGGGVGRGGGEQAGSLVQNGGEAGGLEKAGGPAAPRMAQQRSNRVQNGGEEVGRGAVPMSAPGAGSAGTGPALPPASAPPPEVAPAAAVRGRAREETPAAAAPDTERGSKSRVRGAARASAARAAAAAATAAVGAAAQTGQKGGGVAAGQKRAPAPKSTGPEEVHSYTLALAPGGQMGGLDGKPHETDAPVLLKGAGDGATAPGKKLASSRGGQQHKVRSRKWRSPHVLCDDGS